MLYKYEGPVYRFEDIAIKKFVMYTHASTQQEAMRNFSFKAKRQLKLNKMAKVELKAKYLSEAHTYSGLEN